MKVHAECVDECLVAAARGPQCACDKVCAYLDPKVGWCPRCGYKQDASPQAASVNEDAWKIAGYEYLRRMNPREFTEFWTECLHSTESFDSKVKLRVYAARAQGRGEG